MSDRALTPPRSADVGDARRGFSKGAGLAGLSAMVGAAIPFGRHLRPGFVPAASAQDLRVKDGLTVPGDHRARRHGAPHRPAPRPVPAPCAERRAA